MTAAANSMSTRASHADFQNWTVPSSAPTASQPAARLPSQAPSQNTHQAITTAASADGNRSERSEKPAIRTAAAASQWNAGGFDASSPLRSGRIQRPSRRMSCTTNPSRASPCS